MNKDTVYRQDVIDALIPLPGIGRRAIDKVNSLPSADRWIPCKDCKHYRYGMCMKICANKSTNGFCDWGERRTE